MTDQFIFTAECQDQPGIVSAVSTCLFDNGYFIEEAAQFGDAKSGRFFMRLAIRNADGDVAAREIEPAFAPIAERFAVTWACRPVEEKPKVLLMVSKFAHCLADLLYRHRTGELNAEITAIVSNHPDLEHMAQRAGVPYYHIPVTKETKPQAEAELTKIIEETGTELVVLARYMQVLSSDMCAKYPGRIINIHHSFLPGFKGAKPYHRAHDRGVKLIGATAHYVTSDLDEGPIIEQLVKRVDHAKTTSDLIAIGRDVEASTLAIAVKLHLQRRVFMNGIRTVVFS